MPKGRVAARLADTPHRYGLISRLLHWIIAYLLLWQCLMFIGWRILDDAVMRQVAPFGLSHTTIGVLILILVVPRTLWAIRRARMPGGGPPLGKAARIGHALLYVMMLVVPAAALLRAYGSGKGLILGILPLIPATGHKIDALTAPADLFHAALGWTLAVLVAGHILMALCHHLVIRDGSLGRMAGRRGSQPIR